MKKIACIVFVFFMTTSSVFSQNFIQSLIDQLGGKDVIQNYYNQEKKVVLYFYAKDPTSFYLNRGVKLIVDLADIAGITQEGRDGWVTIWIDVTVSAGWESILPGVGLQLRSFDSFIPDSPESFFSFTTKASVYNWGVDLIKVNSNGLTYLNPKIGSGTGYSLSEEFSIHGNGFEMRSQVLQDVLNGDNPFINVGTL